MFNLRRPLSRGARSRFVVGLLLLTLALTGLLAYEAQRAVRSHHAAATSALEDHAAFVAWQFAGRAQSKLDHTIISPGLFYVLAADGALSGTAAQQLEPETEAEKEKGRKPPPFIRHSFRMNLGNGQLVFNGGGPRPRPTVRRWLATELPGAVRQVYRPDWSFATLSGELDGESHIVFYTIELDEDSTPIVARGFEVDPRGLPTAFNHAFNAPLLPPSLTGGAANSDVLSVAVLGPAGDTLFASRPTYPLEFTASDRLSPQYAGLLVKVALRPESATALIIGGLPRSRLPWLLGLLLLAGGLVAAAIFILRREVEFARLRAEFVSNVSHELRTPLAQIRMFAETLLLDRVRSGEERQRGIEIIDQEARRLSNLVDNVLLFSRAERDATRLSIEPTQMAPLVREVADTFRPLAAAKGITIRTNLEAAVVAPVDSSAIRQILLNFLDNAVKYGPSGQTVTMGLKPLNGRARLCVEDQGPGVPPQDREEIWEAFSRLDRERERAVAGTGIGLSVVRELVMQHDGRAWVEDAQDGGARFVVELPICEAEPATESTAAESTAERGSAGNTSLRDVSIS